MSSSGSDDEGPAAKRGRFDMSASDPNQELEAMLAAQGGGMAPPGMGGMPPGMPPGMGGAGMDFMGGLDGGKGGGKGIPDLFPEPRVQTTPMDFSRMTQQTPVKSVPIPKELAQYLMTPEHRQILTEESGADVEWAPDEGQVDLRGSAEQVKKAQRILQRVTTHCHWGRTEDKVKRLLRPEVLESVVVRLSPMNTLRPAEKILNQGSTMSIGKDKTCDTVIPEAVVSRVHCILELDQERGAVYILDCSTNGTFLNGRRLPAKQAGKVLLSHGDELLLKDPHTGDGEYGYIVNLNVLHARANVKLVAPRRLLTQDEISGSARDFV